MPGSCPLPRKRPLPRILACLLWMPAAAQAGEANPEQARRTLDRVVVVASKVAEPVRQLVGTVSEIDRATMERRQVQTIADLVRYEPGVDAIGDGHRFGWQGFAIRGLDGNRVGMEIDGVPVADAFSVGEFAAAGRDLLDLDAVQRVEILRGPASTLYGSDALAGIVAMRTRDPQDLLGRVGADRYAGGRIGWSGRDHGRLLSAAFAAASGPLQGLLQATRREAHETENASSTLPANPAELARTSLLAKLVFEGPGADRWTATLDHGSGEVNTDVKSLRFGPGRFATTTSLLGDDSYQRDRASVQYEWEPGQAWLEQAELLLYAQRNRTRQDSAQERLADRTTRFRSLRERRFELRQDDVGLEFLGQAHQQGERVRHWHVFGFEMAGHRYLGQRDGRETNLDTGTSSNVILGERFPVRDFPPSRSRELGLFWQDEIGFGEAFALIPGLRWERYQLQAEADAMFREDYPLQEVVDVAHSAWTPKLGARWHASDRSTWFAQYARGFRAPPFGDVNIGLSLALLNYEVRPNPELQPETSAGLEAGWRWQDERLQASVSIYRNQYRDLIESRANLGIDPDTGALVFQSVNRARADIHGVEASMQWVPDAAGDWRLSGSAAWARGRDTARDRPLNSVAPARLVLGAAWEPVSDRFGAELVATAVARQGELDTSAGPLFRAPGYALLDLHAWLRITTGVRLRFSVENLGDRTYWNWSSTRGINLAQASPPLDFHTRPGRSVSLGLDVDW